MIHLQRAIMSPQDHAEALKKYILETGDWRDGSASDDALYHLEALLQPVATIIAPAAYRHRELGAWKITKNPTYCETEETLVRYDDIKELLK